MKAKIKSLKGNILRKLTAHRISKRQNINSSRKIFTLVKKAQLTKLIKGSFCEPSCLISRIVTLLQVLRAQTNSNRIKILNSTFKYCSTISQKNQKMSARNSKQLHCAIILSIRSKSHEEARFVFTLPSLTLERLSCFCSP